MRQFFSVLLLVFTRLDQEALYLLEDSISGELYKVSFVAKDWDDCSKDNLLGILYLLLIYAKVL
jgi:hypothetical protein